MRWICLAALLAPLALTQSPTDVTLTLASKDGRTQFRQGEAIELQLKFQSSMAGKCGVWQRNTYRTPRNPEYDRFTVEPADGTADPLADSPAQIPIEVIAGAPPVPTTIRRFGRRRSICL